MPHPLYDELRSHIPPGLTRAATRLRPNASRLARRLFGLLAGERLPAYEGEIRVTGARDPIRVRRDEYAIPYVDARSEEDAWFGLGFCQAQDRPGQIEIMLRMVRGTLAEVIGQDGVAMDRFSRRVGFRRAAGPQHAVAPEPVKKMFAAFARGVNEGLTKGGPKLDHAFLLLGCEPGRWTVEDLQAYSLSLCFALPSNWDMELMRLKILEEDGPEALRAIDTTFNDRQYCSYVGSGAGPGGPISRAIDHLASDLELYASLVGTGGGSNVWAVAPEKTATGRPILASDPHLGDMAPVQAYLSRLRSPELNAAGASFIGLPGYLSGHNGHAAYGIAAAHADNTDIFLEEIGPDGRSVREGDRFIPCEVHDERITVKGAEPIQERVLVTRRGPIVSPAMPGSPQERGPNALSMAAVWLQPRPYLGLYGTTGARDFETFRRNFAGGSISTVTPVYADASGTIGWQLAADLPVRKKGRGVVPMPGWDEACGWEDDLVPFDDLPWSDQPDEGFFVAANNQPVPEDPEGPFLGADFMDDYRAARIAEKLRERDDWDVTSTGQLQCDVGSIPWREIREQILATPAVGDAARAQDLLRSWDGQVASDSVGAAVFELFVTHLIQRLIREKAPRAAAWALGRGFSPLFPHSSVLARRMGHLVALIREQPPEIFESWDAVIVGALTETMEHLRRRYGDDPSAWTWGAVRPLVLEHPFGEVPPLNLIFHQGPWPGMGDATTVTQGQVDFAAPDSTQLSIPVLRAVYDVGDWDNCRFALAGGQSGNPCSPHYEDQHEVWRSGEGIPIAWSDVKVEERLAGRQPLTLVPG